ncbi:MAG: membrane protein [Flavobacteriales bacterium]|nr:MAG: membrane protein [Flavobacteriales bacterium]
MKSVLFFIHFILTLNILYSQEYKLNYIGSTTTENKIKNFETYKDLVLEIEDSLISLKKTGNINAIVKSFLMIDSLNFNVEIEKNQKIKYLQVINEAKFDELVKNILSSYKSEEGLIKIDETDIIVREISKKLSKEGFPFAKVSFKNHDLSQSSVIKSNLNIDYGSRRYLDKIIVKGYEDFPDNFTKNIFKINKNRFFDIDKATKQSKLIDNTNFARNIKEPEILFTNDSTSLYLYLEKIRRNSFDGFISFDSEENSGKINIQGYAKISLNNTFNTGEKINFDFKSQKNQDRSLNSNFIFPYFLGSPFNLKYSLNLIQKDSSYTSNENSIDLELNLNKVKVGIGFQKNESYSDSQIEFVENFNSKLFNVSSEYFIPDSDDKLISEKFKLLVKYGSGKKIQLNNETRLNKYKLELFKKFNFSSRFKLQSSIVREKINSKNLVNNELIRFGGSESIRGFDDNSIFADGYTLLATNLNFYLNDTIYIYGIFDLANYTNSILDLDQDIYSGGIGFSTLTENGVISINYSKGNNWGNSFNLKNAKINVIFTTFF